MAELSYHKATIQDFDDFYRVKSDHQNVVWSGFSKAPDYDGFKEWYNKQLNSEERRIYIVTCDGVCCGFFYLIHVNNEEVGGGYGVLEEFRGHGIGSFIMSKRVELARQFGYKICSGWVAESNFASAKCFERVGFEKTEESELRHIVLLDKDVKFYKWIKPLQ